MTGSSRGQVVVRPAVGAELAAVARLHRSVFPQYQSSRLGPGFCRALLARYEAHDEATVLVAAGPDGPVGYLVGCPPAVQREVNDSLVLRAVVAGAVQFAGSPLRSLSSAGDALRRARRSARSLLRRLAARRSGGADPGVRRSTANPGLGSAETRVVLIGVAPKDRGSGTADALLVAFATRSAERGQRSADLVVAADNVAAQRCYERNGWRRSWGSEGGSVRFTLDLTGTSPGGAAGEG